MLDYLQLLPTAIFKGINLSSKTGILLEERLLHPRSLYDLVAGVLPIFVHRLNVLIFHQIRKRERFDSGGRRMAGLASLGIESWIEFKGKGVHC
jgi:hypothetical protein